MSMVFNWSQITQVSATLRWTIECLKSPTAVSLRTVSFTEGVDHCFASLNKHKGTRFASDCILGVVNVIRYIQLLSVVVFNTSHSLLYENA